MNPSKSQVREVCALLGLPTDKRSVSGMRRFLRVLQLVEGRDRAATGQQRQGHGRALVEPPIRPDPTAGWVRAFIHANGGPLVVDLQPGDILERNGHGQVYPVGGQVTLQNGDTAVHVQRPAPRDPLAAVPVGTKVLAGQRIGTASHTTAANGPHLRLSQLEPADPEKLVVHAARSPQTGRCLRCYEDIPRQRSDQRPGGELQPAGRTADPRSMSSSQGPVTNKCADKTTGMSLAELIVFVQDCLRRDLDPQTTFIAAVPGWRKNKLEKITANPQEVPRG